MTSQCRQSELIQMIVHYSHINVYLLRPNVVGAQLHRLSTVNAHTDVLKPIHGKII